MCLHIFATWYAYVQAVKDGNDDRVKGFEALFRQAVFDFEVFGSQGQVDLAALQLRESNEELREYFGLDGSRLRDAVRKSKEIMTNN